MSSPWHGIFPPIPTTFDPDSGEVDAGAIAANVDRWMRTGLRGVLALGSNGEAALLDDDESDRVVGAARERVPSDRMLLVGVGRESTRATVHAAQRAADLGADAVLVRTPSFFKTQMTAPALIAHFTAVADASPVPVLLYNLPGVTGVTLTPAIVERLAEHANVRGIKETSPDLERLGQLAALGSDRFAVLCGWAPVACPAFVAGATGAILALANVLPDECIELLARVDAGRLDDAVRLQRRLTPLAQLVTSVYGVAGLKAALDLAGYHGGPVRAPLLPLPSRTRAEVHAAFAGVLAERERRNS